MLKSLWLVATGLLFATGCTEESGAQRCLPGTTQSCVCVSGASGVQSCLPSGTAVGPCECVDTDTRQDTSGDTQTPDDANDIQTPDGDDTGHERDTEVGPNDVNSGDCPVSIITVQEGAEVEPQTVIHLSGEGSSSAASEIVAWEWSVEQPFGSVSVFHPSAFVASPTFEPNVIGIYTFRLKVTDAQGNVSCVTAEYVVTVTLDASIRIELLWHTPADPDETDTGDSGSGSAGTDLDLHVLHPRANGRYFDSTYDCYWENPRPDWGFRGPSDDPSLDRDDSDGAGPENLSLDVPEQNARYRVGVHYWNDWGYGESFATIRIYVYGELRGEWSNVRLVQEDLWDSHYIDWPSGTVTRITTPDELPQITPNYPLFL